MEVREMRPEEHAEAGRITAEAYREFVPAGGDGDWESYLERIADVAARAERTVVFVAVEDGRILGSATLELEGRIEEEDPPLEPHQAEIRMLGVDPDARGRGVAKALMAALEGRALAEGRTIAALHTTPRMEAAQRMYESLGYERREDWTFPSGFVLLSYVKSLV